MADLIKVTIRTLHHYDEIGLVSPHERSSAGYRQYDEGDLERLRQVFTYRALGFALDEIAAILDDPRADAATHLRRQHHLLTDRIHRLQHMLAGVEQALEEDVMSQQSAPRVGPTPEQQIELFGEITFSQEWADSIARTSGESAEFRESTNRMADYTTQDWAQIIADEQEICRRLAQVMAQGQPPNSVAAMDLAEELRGGLRRWFFDCTPALHVALAEAFDQDEPMRSTFEGIAPGL
ncbi:MAG: MerR family transcriptional regulator, partial [Acidimicrobiales bacterium]